MKESTKPTITASLEKKDINTPLELSLLFKPAYLAALVFENIRDNFSGFDKYSRQEEGKIFINHRQVFYDTFSEEPDDTIWKIYGVYCENGSKEVAIRFHDPSLSKHICQLLNHSLTQPQVSYFYETLYFSDYGILHERELQSPQDYPFISPEVFMSYDSVSPTLNFSLDKIEDYISPILTVDFDKETQELHLLFYNHSSLAKHVFDAMKINDKDDLEKYVEQKYHSIIIKHSTKQSEFGVCVLNGILSINFHSQDTRNELFNLFTEKNVTTQGSYKKLYFNISANEYDKINAPTIDPNNPQELKISLSLSKLKHYYETIIKNPPAEKDYKFNIVNLEASNNKPVILKTESKDHNKTTVTLLFDFDKSTGIPQKATLPLDSYQKLCNHEERIEILLNFVRAVNNNDINAISDILRQNQDAWMKHVIHVNDSKALQYLQQHSGTNDKFILSELDSDWQDNDISSFFNHPEPDVLITKKEVVTTGDFSKFNLEDNGDNVNQ
jgi:hypothetical protein